MKKQVKKSLIIFSSLIGIAAIATTAIVTPIELTHKQSDTSSAVIANNVTSSPATSGIVANKTAVKQNANVPTNNVTASSAKTTSSSSTANSNLGPVATNQSNAYFAQLDNFLLAKNSFTPSQIDQMSKIINSTNFFNDDATGASLLANTNVNVNQANATMRSLAQDFVANMQTNGLQRNAVQTFLASKNVPTS